MLHYSQAMGEITMVKSNYSSHIIRCNHSIQFVNLAINTLTSVSPIVSMIAIILLIAAIIATL